MKKKEEKDMYALYFIVWLGFIIYIYATSTLVPSGCKSLDDTKDVVLSCSLCQFFLQLCSTVGIYTGGYLLMFLNKIHGFWIFFKNCKKEPIFFCTEFTILAHCAIQVLVTNIWYIVLLNKGPFSTFFIYNSIYTNVILNKSFKIINKIDIFLP